MGRVYSLGSRPSTFTRALKNVDPRLWEGYSYMFVAPGIFITPGSESLG